MTRKLPKTGGQHSRDPKTGRLKQTEAPTRPAAGPDHDQRATKSRDTENEDKA